MHLKDEVLNEIIENTISRFISRDIIKNTYIIVLLPHGNPGTPKIKRDDIKLIINLKTAYNERGSIGELLADQYMKKYGHDPISIRVYTTGPRRFSSLNKEQKKYLESYGYHIDGYKLKEKSVKISKLWNSDHGYIEHRIAVVYEVKTRWEGAKSKKHYLSKYSLKAYEEAIKIGIPVKLVILTFYDNLEIKIEDVDFHKKYFKIY